MKRVVYLTDAAALYELLSKDSISVTRIDSVSAEMVRVEYSNTANFVDEQANVNVVVAAYTTAYGRLELYKYLDLLGPRCIYFDTGQKTEQIKPEQIWPHI